MANPLAGEVALSIDGERRILRLTLGALAELEDALQGDTVLTLVERFESGTVSARDVLAVISAGLRGGGWTGSMRDLTAMEIEGGFAEAVRATGLLLVRAFSVPRQGQE